MAHLKHRERLLSQSQSESPNECAVLHHQKELQLVEPEISNPGQHLARNQGGHLLPS